MSEPENFFSRWSRLKREPALPENGVDERQAEVDELRAADVLADAGVPAPPPLDLTSLPPIESIVADSDIRQFLEAGVPAELTRAALRSAWTADPAIRGFIGIAEYQWDFNGEDTIPGFGALTAADREAHLLILARQSLGPADSEPLESVDAASPPVSTPIVQQNIDAVDRFRDVDASTNRSYRDGEADAPASEASNDANTEAEVTAPAADAQITRSHGGALPR